MADKIIVVTYIIYVLISVNLTIWVARTLHKRGAIFLVDAFHGNKELADSVNHLLVVGFYLINIGYATLALKYGDPAATAQQAIEYLSTKVGLVLVVLGAMHFFNLFIFSRMRLRGRRNQSLAEALPADGREARGRLPLDRLEAVKRPGWQE